MVSISGMLFELRHLGLMVDTLTPAERSERMSRIKGRDTGPELSVRRIVHGMGYRYRLHRKDLPGKPDLVFPGRRKVIFVHGCFWHRHSDPACKLARLPKSRLEFWETKLEANRERDGRNLTKLRSIGWEPMTVWECEIKDARKVAGRIKKFLGE